MVAAGWAFDPGPDGGEDGATCFYCSLSLDGWEPKDDPEEEHRKRSPECGFFALRERFHGGKGKAGKKRGRKGSVVSARGSGGSVMSVDTTTTAAMEEVEVGVDDSLTSIASTATVTGKKKGGRKIATARAAKGRKRANTLEDAGADPSLAAVYPDLTTESQPNNFPICSSQTLSTTTEPAPARATRKRSALRPSKQFESSTIESSTIDIGPLKKATRGRRAAKSALATTPPRPETPPTAEQRLSDASAQLQEELDMSLSQVMAPQDSFEHQDATPQPPQPPQPPRAAKGKRGVKRSSDGMRKADVEDERSLLDDFPAPPKPAVAKGKRGRAASKQLPDLAVSGAEDRKESGLVDADEMETCPPAPQRTSQAAAAVTKTKAAGPGKRKKTSSTGNKKGRGAGRKASSTRSSKATVFTTFEEEEEEERDDQDLARDEAEIEAELARIAAEQERGDEWEGSPSSSLVRREEEKEDKKKEMQMRALEAEVHGEDEGYGELAPAAATPSPPRGSEDKENDASSALQLLPPTASKPSTAAEPPFLPVSPSRRVPLAPTGTPNRLPVPCSPTKHDVRLTTIVPWIPADLDSIFLTSSPMSTATLATRLGVLTSPEKSMRVEDWVRWRAARAEEDLRSRCEGLVAQLEREGLRALGVLAGS